MKKTWIWILIVAVIVITIVVIVNQPKEESEVIKIGAILPLTGSSSLMGEMARNGLTLAEKNINEEGGINGKNISLVIEDGQADPKTSVSAFNKLITLEKVKSVITTHSSVGLALVSIADDNKIILFVHASHPSLTGESNYVFRHSNVADRESEIISEFISTSLGSKRVAIAAMDDDYGMIFKETLEKLIPSASVNVSITESVIYEQTETDFMTVAQKLKASKPEVIVITGLGNGVGILIRRLHEFGYKGDIVVTLAAVSTGAFQSANESAKGVYYVTFTINELDLEYQKVAKEYKEMFDSEFSVTPLIFYNSLTLLSEAMQVKGVESDSISEYLEGIQYFQGIGEEMDILREHDIVPKLKIEKE